MIVGWTCAVRIVMLCHWVSGFLFRRGTHCLYLQGSTSLRRIVVTFLGCLTMNMKAMCSYKSFGNCSSMSQHHVPLILHHKKHQCENLKSSSRTTYEGWNFNFGNTPLDWIQGLLEWRANAAGRMGPSPTYIHNGSGPSQNGHMQ